MDRGQPRRRGRDGVVEGLGRGHLRRLLFGHQLGVQVAGDHHAEAGDQHGEQAQPDRRAEHVDVASAVVVAGQINICSQSANSSGGAGLSAGMHGTGLGAHWACRPRGGARPDQGGAGS
jgi:hypothetical protein